MTRTVDALVIGAGAGGLGAALTLAEAGADVLVCEALKYPGGCASTFSRRGYRFDAGATLSAGLGEGQLLRTWLERYDTGVTLELLDPVLTLRAPGWTLPIPRDRAAFVELLARQPGVPVASLRAFLDLQGRVAEALWHVIDHPHLLPPLSPTAWLEHLGRAPALAPLAGLVGRSLLDVLRRFGLDHCRPVRLWADALCQITVQCTSEQAEAPFALASLDYPFRGTGHVRGGIGGLAWGLTRAIEQAGGAVRLASRVSGLRREGNVWHATVRGDDVRARQVFANVLPGDLSALVEEDVPGSDKQQRRVASGWGAVTLYLGVEHGPELPEEAFHVEIIQDPDAPLPHGNHMLVSVGDARDTARAPPGQRTVTVSTHLDVGRLRSESPARLVHKVQDRLREGLRTHLPDLAARVVVEMPGSPRTFARFTRRSGGLVGGIPRRVGLGQYLDVWPRPALPGLWLVGDSVLLGQSVLAAATGGHVTARAAWRRMR